MKSLRFMAIDQCIAGCEQGSQQITGHGVEKELKKEGLLSADTLPSPVEYAHQGGCQLQAGHEWASFPDPGPFFLRIPHITAIPMNTPIIILVAMGAVFTTPPCWEKRLCPLVMPWRGLYPP